MAETKRRRVTRQDVLAMAEDLGATVRENAGGVQGEILVEAPPGHHWVEGVHELVALYTPGGKAEAWADLYERMAAGIEVCNAGCEWW